MQNRTKAMLTLADGRVFSGWSVGATGETLGEVVFNTSLMGYQEVLTDPSYRGQIVTMTYPLIGNYGLNAEDVEARRIVLAGFVVRENCPTPSNWRSRTSLHQYLCHQGIVGIAGIDTRALTRHLREEGAQTGIISTLDLDPKSLARRAAALSDPGRPRPCAGSHLFGTVRLDGYSLVNERRRPAAGHPG